MFIVCTPLPKLFLSCFLDDSYSNRYEVIPHCGFDLHFPDISDVEHLLIPVDHLDVFLGKMSIQFLCSFLFIFFIFLFFWLCWVFVSVRGLSLLVASGGHSSLRRAGLSLSRPLLLRSTSSRCAGSVVAHGPSCSAACGIFPDQGSNPCPLHWQADSQPLRHQGSPLCSFLNELFGFPCCY